MEKLSPWALKDSWHGRELSRSILPALLMPSAQSLDWVTGEHEENVHSIIPHTSIQVAGLRADTVINVANAEFSVVHSTEHTNPCGKGSLLHATVLCWS